MMTPGRRTRTAASPCLRTLSEWDASRIDRRQAFDRRHVATVGLPREHQARVDDLAVRDDRARAAVADVASELGAGEIEVFPQQLEERRFRGHRGRPQLTVDLDRHCHHRFNLCQVQNAGPGPRSEFVA
jgi:hypothetical protein